MAANIRKGVVFTWGGDKDTGALGHTAKDRDGDCPLPVAVGISNCVSIAAGPNLTGAVTLSGDLYTWGKGLGLGQGLGAGSVVVKPGLVRFPAEVLVRSLSFGSAHTVCLSQAGELFVWGSNAKSQLGLGKTVGSQILPYPLTVCSDVSGAEESFSCVGACENYSAAASKSGVLYTWGASGCLGHGSNHLSGAAPVPTPKAVSGALAGEVVTQVSLGSLYMGCCTQSGRAFTWGYGGHGNLGLGGRKSASTPQEVGLPGPGKQRAVGIACTVGQMNPSGGLNPKATGQEGPHTLLVVEEEEEAGGSGTRRIYSFGTCHKGLLGNLAAKTLTADHDELSPYLVGSPPRDLKPSAAAKAAGKWWQEAKAASETAEADAGAKAQAGADPSGAYEEAESKEAEGIAAAADEKETAAEKENEKETAAERETAAASADEPEVEDEEGPTHGGKIRSRKGLIGNVVGVASASIHNLCWNDRGELWAFGCGSGGRCGVAYFVVGANPGKPRKSRMKAYMSDPNRVGAVWPPTQAHAQALAGLGLEPVLQTAFVRGAAASRYHGVCIADLDA
mmetsp:Transcript_30840/g.69245  ORF Transcript_30840/g.69245 Transcript_30840/m.69245 type:complete len:563 (+) Transcript_30840:190-1878(+)